MSDIQKDLLPCPFCGSNKVRFLNDRSVQCPSCGAGTPDHQAWNDRTAVAHLESGGDTKLSDEEWAIKITNAMYGLDEEHRIADEDKLDAALEVVREMRQSFRTAPCGAPMRSVLLSIKRIMDEKIYTQSVDVGEGMSVAACHDIVGELIGEALGEISETTEAALSQDALNSVGQSAPDGWQLVPKEPTNTMKAAASEYKETHPVGRTFGGYYRAMLAAAPSAPTQDGWLPIAQYKPKPYAGYDEKVLVGWWQHEGGGYRAAVRSFGVGYLGLDKKWHDVSDQKVWPQQPTHFALVCNDISLGRKDGGE